MPISATPMVAAVDHELPVFPHADPEAIQRARRGPFEIESGLKKTTAVARALELVFGRLPAGRASQMGAFGKNRIDARFLAHDPNPLFLLVFVAYLAHCIVGRKARFKGYGRLEKNPGKGGANKTQKAKAGKNAESAPTQTGEKVSARPNASFVLPRFFAFVRCHNSLPFNSLDPTDHCAPENKDQTAQHQRQPYRTENKRETRSQKQDQDAACQWIEGSRRGSFSRPYPLTSLKYLLTD